MSKFLIDEECIAQREYVNIPRWHEAGYTGKDITVFCDDVGDDHAECVADIIQVILPDAKIYTGSIGYSQQGEKIVDCVILCKETQELLPFDQFIKKYKVSLINNSTDGGEGEKIFPIAEYMKEKIKQYNLIFCGAAGNVLKGETRQKYNGACIVVTSVNLRNGKPVYGMKSIGPNVDFAMFHGFQSGSSFSSPFLLGMAGLLRSKYPYITQDEVYEYFKEQSEQIGTMEKSEEFGWGVPIMGDLQTMVTMQIGNSTMSVDGKEITLEQPPMIDRNTGRTLVPIRAIAEAFGAEVQWDSKTKTITIIK